MKVRQTTLALDFVHPQLDLSERMVFVFLQIGQ